jgi:hypothetical protein
MDLVAQAQQVIGEVTPVLTGDSRNQRLFRHAGDCSAQRNMDLKDNRRACVVQGFCLKWPFFNRRWPAITLSPA